MKVLSFANMNELKEYMDEMTKSLGVTCKYCHDLREIWRDTEHKQMARDMILIQKEFDKRIDRFRDTFIKEDSETLERHKKNNRLSCFTCHRGQIIPQNNRSNLIGK